MNFALRERELRCLIGPNGAGKSTFFKSITGQLRGAESSGRVFNSRRGGDQLADLPDHASGRRRQDAGPVGDERADVRGKPVAVRIPANPEAVEATVEEIVGGTGPAIHRATLGRASLRTDSASLSRSAWCSPTDHGWCCSTNRPPASPATRCKGWSASSARSTVTAALIVVDHDMHFVRMLEAEITVFNQGTILVEGSADRVLNDPRVREVYLGNRAR